jgi:hypothetical protein
MATFACYLDVFTARVSTGLSAILLARCNLTKAWNVRALGLFLICHLQFLLFTILVLGVSIREPSLTIHCMQVSKRRNPSFEKVRIRTERETSGCKREAN